jgi:ribonuclease E
LLNEKRNALVYLEQNSNVRITVLPHAHLETPHYHIQFNREGFSPSSFERVETTRISETGLGYEASDWQQQPTADSKSTSPSTPAPTAPSKKASEPVKAIAKPEPKAEKVACAWMENLFVTKQAKVQDAISSQDAAAAIERLVNEGAVSKGLHGTVNPVRATEPKEREPEPVKPVASNSIYQNMSANATESNAQPAESNRPNRNRNRNRNPQRERDQQREQPREREVQQREVIAEVAPVLEEQQPQHNNPRGRSRRQHNQLESADSNVDNSNSVPRRDRNSQSRSGRGPRQRDASVLEQQDNTVVATTQKDLVVETTPVVVENVAPATSAPVVINSDPHVIVVDQPAPAETIEALVVNVDSQQTVAINLPVAETETAHTPVAVASEQHDAISAPVVELVEEKSPPAEAKRALNDPRERRRRRELGLDEPALQFAVDPALTAQSEEVSQQSEQKLVTLPIQGSAGEFIRAVLGESAEALLAEGQLVSAFLQALAQRQQVVVETAPAIIEEVAPTIPETVVELIPVTPPTPGVRAANDPRLRRQQQLLAAQTAVATTDDVASDVVEAESAAVALEAATETPIEASVIVESAAIADDSTFDTVTEPVDSIEVLSTEAVVEIPPTALEPVSATEEPLASTVEATDSATHSQGELLHDDASDDDLHDASDDKSVGEKPARPRRPRGRPPKKPVAN